MLLFYSILKQKARKKPDLSLRPAQTRYKKPRSINYFDLAD